MNCGGFFNAFNGVITQRISANLILAVCGAYVPAFIKGPTGLTLE